MSCKSGLIELFTSQSVELEKHRKPLQVPDPHWFWKDCRVLLFGVSCILCWNILWYSVYINCDIWLQEQDSDMESYSLTAWKYLKFLWQSDPEISWVTGFLYTHILQLWPKMAVFSLERKKKAFKTLCVRVKHAWCFQNTNYNWIVSWDLLKALVWLIYLPSTLCCWSECQPLNWLNFAFSERLIRDFSSCMWEHTNDFKNNVSNKIMLLLRLSTLANYFTEQKWILAVFGPSYCELYNPHCFRECFANNSLDSIGWPNDTSWLSTVR